MKAGFFFSDLLIIVRGQPLTAFRRLKRLGKYVKNRKSPTACTWFAHMALVQWLLCLQKRTRT